MLIEAFKKAFPRNKNVELILKPSNFSEEFQKSIYEAIGNSTRIKILNKFLPESDFYQFMKSLDCFVSPHRSEGFGLHCAECMAIGTPVIATGYSGNMEFMNDKNSFLIDYKLVKSTDHYYGDDAHWAQPDMDSLVDLMKSSLVKDEKRIMEAKKDIDTICSPNSVRNIMNSLI
jgi:glycosyltransferase involved in cell wall biosynthesis